MAAPLNMQTFWARVDKNGPVHPILGSRCWLWRGGLGGKGRKDQRYGQSGTRRAHRVAYEVLVGAIPRGLILDHLCRCRQCVNPSHVEVVTHRINILRGVGLAAQNANKTHCKHGHPLCGDNLLSTTGRRGLPRRVCRACAVVRKQRFKERHAC